MFIFFRIISVLTWPILSPRAAASSCLGLGEVPQEADCCGCIRFAASTKVSSTHILGYQALKKRASANAN